MTDAKLVERAKELMAEWGVACDCGWRDGNHAPECAVEAAWADAMAAAEDEAFGEPPYEEPYEGDGEDYLDGDAASALASAGWGVDEDYGFVDIDGGFDTGGW